MICPSKLKYCVCTVTTSLFFLFLFFKGKKMARRQRFLKPRILDYKIVLRIFFALLFWGTLTAVNTLKWLIFQASNICPTTRLLKFTVNYFSLQLWASKNSVKLKQAPVALFNYSFNPSEGEKNVFWKKKKNCNV